MKDKNTHSRLLNELSGLAETMLISLFVVSLAFTYIFRTTTIIGSSMNETLSEGDRVIMTAWYNSPKQGDVVVIDAQHAVTFDESGSLVTKNGIDKMIVKRIIAVEGQKVDFDFVQGKVYVDNKLYSEPYISGLTHLDEGGFPDQYPVTVPKGYVFVMGDNRRDSQDSRSYRIGFVPVDDIQGKVLMRISPIIDFGIID